MRIQGAVIPADLGGMICDYDRIFSEIVGVEERLDLSLRINSKLHYRVAVISDGAHAFGSVEEWC